MIKEALQQFGLSDKETAVYMATLEMGDATVQKIARKSNEKRPTTYVLLESLKQRGLVTEHVEKNSRHFYAAPPQTLLHILKDQQRHLERQEFSITKIIPELETLYNLSDRKPKVQMYEGVDGLKAIYEDTLRDNKEILAFTGVSEAVTRELADWLNADYVARRVKKKVLAKVIAPDTGVALQYHKSDAKSARETRLVSAQKFPFTIEVNIYNHKVALVSFKENELIGVLIESPEIARTMRSIFWLAWSASSKTAK
ncbi:MAG: helix-turn-helix domain-containing protein [Patescibacteria group bacterium]|jgi:sugar-specific transcriptional regulator TrmB